MIAETPGAVVEQDVSVATAGECHLLGDRYTQVKQTNLNKSLNNEYGKNV